MEYIRSPLCIGGKDSVAPPTSAFAYSLGLLDPLLTQDLLIITNHSSVTQQKEEVDAEGVGEASAQAHDSESCRP